MQTILETERLLRTWSLDDAAAVFVLTSDPLVMRFLSNNVPDRDVDEARRRVERAMAHHEKHRFGLMALVEKSTGELIGSCGVKHVYEAPVIELAYHLRRDRWNRGYATEAARATVRYGFEDLGLERIAAFVDEANLASRRVLEKCGLCLEGPGEYGGAPCLVYATSGGLRATK
jgi:RimJ/RimL family protein N-acetyltransferase